MQLFCVGDVALNINTGSQLQWAFPGSLRSSDDVKIIFNMELPISEQVNEKPRSKGPRLLSTPQVLSRIKSWSPGFATLATNHILDGGETGLAHTLFSLKEEGFSTVGAGMNQSDIIKPLIWETAEGSLAILNWVFAETNPDWMQVPGPNCWPGMSEASSKLHALKKEVDWILIIAHWSDELFGYPTLDDREIAKSLINKGADIVIGHHPHVVRGFELVAEKPIYYSLGNFFFSEFKDQKSNLIFRPVSRNKEALVVKITFVHGQKPTVEPLSFWQNHNQTKPDPFKRAVRRLNKTSQPLEKYFGVGYLEWYKGRRKFFNAWEYRMFFSLGQRGWFGAASYLLSKVNVFHKS
jgi:hypothetical protein